MREVGQPTNNQRPITRRQSLKKLTYDEKIQILEIVIKGFRNGKYIDEIALDAGITEAQVSYYAMQLRKEGLRLPRLPRRSKRRSVRNAVKDVVEQTKQVSDPVTDMARKHSTSW